jgi:hypothetical protein
MTIPTMTGLGFVDCLLTIVTEQSGDARALPSADSARTNAIADRLLVLFLETTESSMPGAHGKPYEQAAPSRAGGNRLFKGPNTTTL